MDKVPINSIIYYGRSYSDEQLYYLNLHNMSVYSKDELINNLGYTESMFNDFYMLRNDYNLVPLFHLNIIDEMRLFLINLNNRNILEDIKKLKPDELYVYFQKYIEINASDHRIWREYEKTCLTNAAVKWCKEWNIPFSI